jgi:signal peptidase I
LFWAGAAGAALGLAVLVLLWVRRSYKVFYLQTPSMEPTIIGHTAGQRDTLSGRVFEATERDHVLVDLRAYRRREPEIGHIVAFRSPPELSAQFGGAQFTWLKRVVGRPGDSIQFADGMLLRNGEPITEPYLAEPMQADRDFLNVYGGETPVLLAASEVFVAGDHRNNSNDSRFWGPVHRRYIVGHAIRITAPRARRRLLA